LFKNESEVTAVATNKREGTEGLLQTHGPRVRITPHHGGTCVSPESQKAPGGARGFEWKGELQGLLVVHPMTILHLPNTAMMI
jgi:hypothetical protein